MGETVTHCRWCGLEIRPAASLNPVSTGWIETRWRRGMSMSLFMSCTGTGSPSLVHEPSPDAGAEAYWRARNKAIAEAHQREMAEHRGHQAVMGEWHEGTCVSCGMDDLPVIGLPGSEYCRNCEELRVLNPPKPVVTSVDTPVRPVRPRLLGASVLLAIAGFLLTFADGPQLVCGLLFTASFLLARAA